MPGHVLALTMCDQFHLRTVHVVALAQEPGVLIGVLDYPRDVAPGVDATDVPRVVVGPEQQCWGTVCLQCCLNVLLS